MASPIKRTTTGPSTWVILTDRGFLMSRTKLETLLHALGPTEADLPVDLNLQIEGYLLRGGEETLRIVIGDLALEFAIEDVLEVAEVEGVPPERSSLAVPVRLTLNIGARLMGCSPAAAYHPLLDRVNQPFAYEVRKSYPPMQQAPRFRALERAFRQRHGLE
jgi:hypothetical protein